MRFPRNHRLTNAADFRRVFARPVVAADEHFKMLGRPAQGHARLGLAVSRRNCPRAVDRNRLKRLVRESFRAHADTLEGDGAADVVVMVRPSTHERDNARLAASLAALWPRLARRIAAARAENENTIGDPS